MQANNPQNEQDSAVHSNAPINQDMEVDLESQQPIRHHAPESDVQMQTAPEVSPQLPVLDLPLPPAAPVVEEAPEDPLEVLQEMKSPFHFLSLVDDLVESQAPYLETNPLDPALLRQMTPLERAVTLSAEVQKTLNRKHESVTIFSLLNNCLEAEKEDIIATLAGQRKAKREESINQIFTELASLTTKETFVQRHLYLKQIMLFYRNIVVNYLPRLMLEHKFCQVVEVILQPNCTLYRNLGNDHMSNNLQPVGANANYEMNKVRWMNELSKKFRHAFLSKHQGSQEWRTSLKVGDQLDAVASFLTPNSHKVIGSINVQSIDGWTPGKVIQVDDENHLLIGFVGCPSDNNIYVDRESLNIAPLGTYTNDWSWRQELKEWDEVSAADDYGNWYRSTLFDIRQVDNEIDCFGNPIMQARVAFRFKDPYGTKTDELGNKYTGWKADEDRDLRLCLPNIQRVHDLTFHYNKIASHMKLFDLNEATDLLDMIFPSTHIHQYCIRRKDYYAGLEAIGEMLNEFGMMNGFETILGLFRKIASGDLIITQEHFLSLQNFLKRCLPMYTRQFTCRYSEILSDAYFAAICSEKSHIMKNLQQKDFQNLTNSYEALLKRNYMKEKHEKLTATLKINLGATFLVSDNLQKRINGIRLVNEEIKTYLRYNSSQELQDRILQEFDKIDLFSQVYNKRHMHLELVKRSAEIIKLYARNKKLTSLHIDKVWDCTDIDETMQIEIYNVVQATGSAIHDQDLEKFILKVKNQEPSKITLREIEFLHQIGKSAHQKSAARLLAIQALWQCALLEKPGYSLDLLSTARKHCFDLLRTQEREVIEQYVMQALLIVEQKTGTSLQALKLFKKLVDLIPKNCYNTYYMQKDELNLAMTLKQLCIEHHLFRKVLDDLEWCLQGKSVDEGYDRKKQIWQRLRTILYVLQNSEENALFKAEDLQRAWALFFNSASTKEELETSLFFDFVYQLITMTQWGRENSQVVSELFKTQVMSNQEQFLAKGTSASGFHLLMHLFLQTNEMENLLTVTSSRSLTQFANIGKLDCKRHKVEFRVHIPPQNLLGTQVLWEFFTRASSRPNDFNEPLVHFLAQVYGSPSGVLTPNLSATYQDFTQTCFTKMQQIAQSQSLDALNKKELLKGLMLMLKQFFTITEKQGGTASIRPHSALACEQELISSLLVISNLQIEDTPKYMLFSVPANMTAWELQDYVARKVNKSTLKVQLSRNPGKHDIKPLDFCKSLRQLQIENGEEINLMKSTAQYQKLPLINPYTGGLVKEAEQIFVGWFNKYSMSRDEIANLPETHLHERYMTKHSALEFLQDSMQDSRQANNHISFQKKLTVDDHRIKDLFDNYDLDKDGLLTVDDFVRFYRTKSIQNADTVWHNLQANGYGYHLQKENKQSQTYASDLNITRDPSQLPRAMVGENLSHLETLFQLESASESTNEQIWDLINSLKTNTPVFETIKACAAQLKQMLSPEHATSFKLLYYLQIVKHFVDLSSAKKVNAKCSLYFTRQKVITQNYNEEFPKIGEEKPERKKWAENPQSLEQVDERDEQIEFKTMGASSHQDQGKHSNRVIPLPAAGQSIAAAEDQPQNAASLSYNMQQIKQWPGEIVTEELDIQMNGDMETTEGCWLVTFLQEGGFEPLVKLLVHFVGKNNLGKSMAERKCVQIVTYLIKVILMSCFSASLEDQDMAGNLSRKMSHNSQGPAPLPPKEAEAKNEIEAEFQQVIECLRECGFTPKMLMKEDPQMKSFTSLLKQIFEKILGQPTVTEEERSILGECLNIWISLITYNPDIMASLYQDKSYLTLLVDRGLLAENDSLRSHFKDAIEFIALKIKQADLPQHPTQFFLSALVERVPTINHANSLHTAQFFQLLSTLMKEHSEMKNSRPMLYKQAYDTQALVQLTLRMINEYKSIENRQTAVVDNTLVGLLTLVRDLISSEEGSQVLSQQHKSEVLNMLVEKCLFNQQQAQLTQHISPDVDYQKISQQSLNKCHTEQSREAAYALFQALIEQEPDPEILGVMVQKYWSPAIVDIAKVKASQSGAKDSGNRSELGYAGIRNLGCVCYMNAIIQQFYHVPAFRYCLLSVQDGQPPNIAQHPNGHEFDDNSLHQWIKMFGALELTEREFYDPVDFCQAYKTYGQPTNVREQQDAQEFVTGALDKLEQSMKDGPMRNLVKSIFLGQSTSIMLCSNCGNTRMNHEDFSTLNLQVKNQKDIYSSLRNMVAGELIQDYQCSNCNQKVELSKKQAIHKLPNTLICHLNRIVFDFDSLRNVKLNDRFEFPNVLNLREFMLEQVMKDLKKEEQNEGQNEDSEMRQDNQEEAEEFSDSQHFEYKLVGVVIHMGIADAGHYMSYINVDRTQDSKENTQEWLKTENQRWLEFNDTSVRQFDFSQLAYKCFGESKDRQVNNYNYSQVQGDFQDELTNTGAQVAHNAYMLVYEKTIKSPVSVVLDKATIEVIEAQRLSLACDGATIPRELQNNYAFYVFPQLMQKVLAGDYSEDLTVKMPLCSARKFVSNEVFQQVNADNQLHIAESQIICNPFFKTTAALLNSLAQYQLDEQQLKALYNLLDKLIFDLLVRTTQNDSLVGLASLMEFLVDSSNELLVKLITERILVKQKQQDSVSEYPFFELLIFNSSESVRQVCEQLLTYVTNKLFSLLDVRNIRNLNDEQIEYLQNTLKEIIGVTTDLIPNKIQSAWHKLASFFNFFYNLAKNLDHSKLLMLRKAKLVSKFVEMVCKIRDHYQQGFNFVVPPIENALRTIGLLVRSQPLCIWLYKVPTSQQVTIEEYEQLLTEQPDNISPYREQTSTHLYLDPECLRALFMSEKRSQLFWENVLQYLPGNEALQDICRTLSHLCFRNYDFSKKVAKILLTYLQKTNADEVRPFGIAMQWFLTIPDEFQEHRLEWLCGVANFRHEKEHNANYNYEVAHDSVNIGAGLIKDVQDTVNDFHTTLLKDQQKMFEPVFTMLYAYRKMSFVDACLEIMESLLNATLKDARGQILKFLLYTPPPSYICSNYWEWLEPYLITSIEEDCGGNFSQTTERQMRCHALIQQIKETHAAVFVDTKEKTPQPYLVWSTPSKQDIKMIKNERKMFQVILQEWNCMISKSTPNPAKMTNDNIDKVDRMGWNYNQPVIVPKSSKKDRRVMRQQKFNRGRGRRQGQVHRPQPQANLGAFARPKHSSNMVQENAAGSNGEENFEEYRENDEPLEGEGAAEQFYAQNFGEQQDERPEPEAEDGIAVEGGSPRPEQEGEDQWTDKVNYDSDPQNIDSSVRAVPSVNASPVAGPIFDSSGAAVENIEEVQLDGSAADNADDQAVQEAMEQLSQDSQDDETTKYEVECVMQIFLRNFNQLPQTCQLKFKKLPGQNYTVPKSIIQQRVNKTTDHYFFRFVKLRPCDAWGPIEIELAIDNEDQHGNDVRWEYNWPQLRESRMEVMAAQLAAEQDQNPEPNEVQNDYAMEYEAGGGATAFDADGDGGIISCPTCTYDNAPGSRVCEMCDTNL